jgi:hypothetical protein
MQYRSGLIRDVVWTLFFPSPAGQVLAGEGVGHKEAKNLFLGVLGAFLARLAVQSNATFPHATGNFISTQM